MEREVGEGRKEGGAGERGMEGLWSDGQGGRGF